MDAPLGWPRALAPSLAGHQAGDPLAAPADELFRRETDRVVQQLTKKRPMEVAADKIARVALRCVKLIGELREQSGLALPLAWSPAIPTSTSVIEVYPATSLRARGLSDSGYKGSKPANRARRVTLVEELQRDILISGDTDVILDSDDALDAVTCLISAADFIRGDVVVPQDRARAEREGWIWFRSRRSEPVLDDDDPWVI
jgi:hypothetical protein